MKDITRGAIFIILFMFTIYHLTKARYNEKIQESIYHAAMAIIFFISLIGSQIGAMIA